MYVPKDWRPLSICLWQHLIAHRDNERLFFHDVARDVGVSQRHLNYPLTYIMEFCERKTLPPLTAIVLNKHDYTKRRRLRPSAHFRLKHGNDVYFPGDEQFDALYQQQLKQVREMNWQPITYEPSLLEYFDLKKILMETKGDNTSKPALTISLAQLARR
ncbi:hypothetical protein [Vibrio owensii]|uniref:hypothetical protein n=1 Tax=Vibrio owensii TaxID=696485 RepID=UPI0038CE2E6C